MALQQSVVHSDALLSYKRHSKIRPSLLCTNSCTFKWRVVEKPEGNYVGLKGLGVASNASLFPPSVNTMAEQKRKGKEMQVYISPFF